MNSFRRFFDQYEIPGWALAIGLVIVSRSLVWWGYILLRHNPYAQLYPSSTQAICILYCSFFAWVLVFLCANLRMYSGMTKDAFLGGGLLSIAAVLRDADISQLLSNKGFAGASWIALICICGLLIRISLVYPQNRKNEKIRE